MKDLAVDLLATVEGLVEDRNTVHWLENGGGCGAGDLGRRHQARTGEPRPYPPAPSPRPSSGTGVLRHRLSRSGLESRRLR
jgi:hypothetical protein